MGSRAISIQSSHFSRPKAVLLSGGGPAPLSGGMEDDARLMERLSNGDEIAFAALLRKYSGKFYRVACRFTRNHAEAEDIVQEAFLKLWARPFLWQPGKNTAFTTWFYRIVVNLCLDHGKKKRPDAIIDDSWVADDRQSQEEVLLQNEKQKWLALQIAGLPPRQRMALNLCFYEEMSNKDAAQVMGIRVKALESLLVRAKTEMKLKLQKTMEGQA